jgi:hypothetical protein
VSRYPLQFCLKLGFVVGLFFIIDRGLSSLLKIGLDHYYGLDVPADILLIGHSHTELGIDKLILERELGLRVAKFTVIWSDVRDRYVMLQHYLSVQPAPKVIVYDVDAYTFSATGRSSEAYPLFYPYMDHPAVGQYLRSQSPARLDLFIKRAITLTRYDDSRLNASLRGWTSNWGSAKHATIDMNRLTLEIAKGYVKPITFDTEWIERFEQSLHVVRGKGIPIVLLFIPTIDRLAAVDPGNYAKALDRFRGYQAQDEDIVFLDYNPEFAHQHDLFYDPIHLNVVGQYKVTERLALDLRRILNLTGKGHLEQPSKTVVRER